MSERNGNGNYTLDRVIMVGIWWHLSSSAELGSGNLGSHSEAVNAMLRVDEFQGGTRCRVMRSVTDSELAEICQQHHVSVMDVIMYHDIWNDKYI